MPSLFPPMPMTQPRDQLGEHQGGVLDGAVVEGPRPDEMPRTYLQLSDHAEDRRALSRQHVVGRQEVQVVKGGL